jgi:Bacterial capsule synthesis protein PGA_cap
VEIAAGLAATGWDGCSTASNHSVDRGASGVTATLDALDAVGLGHVGTARSAEEAAAPQVYTLHRGQEYIRIAHIAATYGTNGLPIPADSPWMVSTIDSATLIAQATAARAAGADIVVASIHCCVEYVSAPTQDQVQIASDLAASGVIDLVIGHHAHVPQSITLLPGGPNGGGMWVAYGLGNFVSNQDAACCVAATDSGLLLTATFTKPYQGPPMVTSVEWSGITVDRSGGHQVLPLSAAVAAGSGYGTVSAADLITRRQRVVDVVGTEASERTEPPVATGTPPIVEHR